MAGGGSRRSPQGDRRAWSTPRPSRLEAIRPLYFLHIPRTAGTALTAELDNRFAAADIFPGSLLFQLVDAPSGDLGRYRLFRGHFGLVLPRLLRWQLRGLTVLREPAAMVTSLYAFIRTQPWHPLHHRFRQPGYGLSRFLHDPVCRVVTSNWQARWLAAEPPPGDLAWTTVPSDLVGWKPSVHHRPLRMGQEELLERSAGTIERLSMVGVTERLPETLCLVAGHLGWPPPEPPARRNVSPLPADGEALSAADLELLRELNQVDTQLYDSAWQRLDRDLRASPQALNRRSPSPRSGGCDYDCSMPLVGRGWRPLHRAFDGRFGWYRWSGPATESVVELPVAVDGP